MATCRITLSVFSDHSGSTSLSLQNFTELNKLSVCLGKYFFFSPGLCENRIPNHTDWRLWVYASMIVCVSMNVCLSVYMSPKGAEVGVFTGSGVQALILPSPPKLSFFLSCIILMKTEQRDKERENYFRIIKGQPVCSKAQGPCP